MNLAESSSNLLQSRSSTSKSHDSSSSELIDIDQVLKQKDIELLKAQLAAAHQLLNHRQEMVDSLSEQVQFQEASLAQTERQVDNLSDKYQSQALELAEMRTICTDLRSQLKRQNRRQGTGVPPVPHSQRLGFQLQSPASARASVSFGYESTEESEPYSPGLTKAPPVKTWSASQHSEAREEISLYQKLTTFMVEPAACNPALVADDVINGPECQPSPHYAVQLPHFSDR
ncbi:MAG: hypothetical protein AAGB01_03455 [Cyanobacteria bacterium P01_F01_bin.42]